MLKLKGTLTRRPGEKVRQLSLGTRLVPQERLEPKPLTISARRPRELAACTVPTAEAVAVLVAGTEIGHV